MVLTQMNDVKKFGVKKFHSNKPINDLDDNVLYVSKKNIGWRNWIIK